MPYVPVEATRLYYREDGPASGSPVLLLHAALQTSESMAPLVKLLTPHGFRTIAPDLRGYGRSSNPQRTLPPERLALDMAQFLAYLKLQKPIVIGYSLGGIVAMQLAAQGLVSGLVVMASRIHPAPMHSRAFDPESIRERAPLWAKQLAEKHEEMPWEELSGEIGYALKSWEGLSHETLRTIAVPTLIVQGDKDEMVPIEQAREIAAHVPGAQLREIPHAKHPELLYRADALKAVEEFLTGLPQLS